MRKSYLKKVATKSFVGRVLRRLLGEEKGTVMMEYIVLGLLIVSVAVIAVGIFGGALNDMFAHLTEVATIQPDAADANLAAARTRAQTDMAGKNATHVNVIKRTDTAADNNNGAANW